MMDELFVPAMAFTFITGFPPVAGAAKSSFSPAIPADSCQMILVIGHDWDDLHCRMCLCELVNGKWLIQNSFPAVGGEKGMAWGIGLYPQSPVADGKPVKKEGDLKSPVGVFQFGECMGYAPELAVNPRLEYRQITASIQGVDDPASRFYNQIIDTASLKDGVKADWKSYEKMRRTDDLYKWLIVIKHNPANIRGWGSLIFLHVWKNKDSGTAGCTAVAESNILEIFKWLDSEKNPVLVQLPGDVYRKKMQDWGLPSIDAQKTTL